MAGMSTPTQDNPETMTTVVDGFWMNADEENQPAKIKAGDENYYSTFKPGEVFEDYTPSEGDEIELTWYENDSGYRTIQAVKPYTGDKAPDHGQDQSSQDAPTRKSDGYVSNRERQGSIEAQKALDKAVDTELSLSARDDDYEFKSEGVEMRAADYLQTLKNLKAQGDDA